MALEFPRNAKVRLIEGAGATGKTHALIDRLEGLASSNEACNDNVLVIAPSPDAARMVEGLITERGIGRVDVLTARDLALEALSSPQAQAATGRKPRLLSKFETSFLLEDMKTCGLRPKRIRELVGFFCRSWTELADFEDRWLIYKEEEETHRLLKSLLDSYGAYIEPELANRAVRYLVENPDALEAQQRRCVLVDDYHALSRASQYLVNLVASQDLVICANPDICVRAYDSYPYAKGVEELKDKANMVEHTVLSVSALPDGTLRALQALAPLADADGRTDNGLLSRTTSEPNEDGFTVVACEDPADECARLVSWTANRLAEGARPRDVAVIVPNRTWERNVRKSLCSKNIPVLVASAQEDIGGDVRFNDRCKLARLVTLLHLAADLEDVPALRAWCGFGDELTNRQVFREVFDLAAQERSTVAQIVARIASEAADGSIEDGGRITFKSEARKIAEAMNELHSNVAALRDLQGGDLVRKAAEIVGMEESTAQTAYLFSNVRGTDDARAIAVKLDHKLQQGAFPDEDAVRILPVQRSIGLQVKHIAACGMVSGFVPAHAYFDRTKKSPDQAARMLGRDAEEYIEALGKGTDSCAVFCFKEMLGADAEAHQVSVDRFFAKDGKRHAKVHQSLLIDAIEGKGLSESAL